MSEPLRRRMANCWTSGAIDRFRNALTTRNSSPEPAGRCQSDRCVITRLTRADPVRPRPLSSPGDAPQCRQTGVMVEHPFGESLETFVIEVATAVEPHPRRARDANAVVALDDVRRAAARSSAGVATPRLSGDPIVTDEHGRDDRSEHVVEVPQVGAGGTADHGLGISTARGSTARLERVGRRRHSVHALWTRTSAPDLTSRRIELSPIPSAISCRASTMPWVRAAIAARSGES